MHGRQARLKGQDPVRTLREHDRVALPVAARAQQQALAGAQVARVQGRAHLHVPAPRVHLACTRTR